MSGRKPSKIVAKPSSLRITDEAYVLTAIITEGPNAILDRLIHVHFSAEQLDAIAEWNPTEVFTRLDLDNLPKSV